MRSWVGLSLVGLFALTLFFSTYALTESPRVWYDEGYYLQLAIHQARHGSLGLQVAPGEFVSASTVSLGFPLVYPVAFSFQHFGVGVLQARAVMVVFILALLAAALTLIYYLFGRSVALLSGALLATFPILYGDGKNMLGEVPGLFYLFTFLVSVWRLEASAYHSVRAAVAAGVFAGLCVATKPIFLMLLPAILIALFLCRSQVSFTPRVVLAGIVPFILLFAVWVSTQFFSSDAAGAIASHYLNPYGLADMAHAVLKNFVGLFTHSTPLEFLLFGLAWVAGIVVRTRRGVRISLAEMIALAFSFLVLLAYLRTDGWYRYFFPAHLIALVFTPASLLLLFSAVRKQWLATAGVILLSLFQLYLLSFHSFVAEYYQSTTTATLSVYFGNLDPHKNVFLYNVPEVAIFLPTDAYYQYLRPTDAIETGAEQLQHLIDGTADIVVAPEAIATSTLNLSPLYRETDLVDRYRIFTRVGPF